MGFKAIILQIFYPKNNNNLNIYLNYYYIIIFNNYSKMFSLYYPNETQF